MDRRPGVGLAGGTGVPRDTCCAVTGAVVDGETGKPTTRKAYFTFASFWISV
jgi:hypothetical protein